MVASVLPDTTGLNFFLQSRKISISPHTFIFSCLDPFSTLIKHMLILTLGFKHWQIFQFSQHLTVWSKDLQQKTISVFAYTVAGERHCRTVIYYITCQYAQLFFFFNCIFYGMLKLCLITCCRVKSSQGYSASHLSTWLYLKEISYYLPNLEAQSTMWRKSHLNTKN